MNIAVYSITRDRFDYTKHCFGVLRDKAGMPFDHYVIDNGSTDGTQEWLREHGLAFKYFALLTENMGISWASNLAIDAILKSGEKYDLIIKMDNDCEVLSDDILWHVCELYQQFGPYDRAHVLSPYVEGINRQPKRGGEFYKGNYVISKTAIVGGLFHIVPTKVYANYRYPVTLPKAWGQDDDFCHFVKSRGGEVGYIENLKVAHYETTDGQAKRYPQYFERKWKEEKEGINGKEVTS